MTKKEYSLLTHDAAGYTLYRVIRALIAEKSTRVHVDTGQKQTVPRVCLEERDEYSHTGLFMETAEDSCC